jgi:hypothetical protein
VPDRVQIDTTLNRQNPVQNHAATGRRSGLNRTAVMRTKESALRPPGSKPDKLPFTGRRSGCLVSDFATGLAEGSGELPDTFGIDQIDAYRSKMSLVMVENALICPYERSIVIEVTTYWEFVGEGARRYETYSRCGSGRYGGCVPTDKATTGLIRYLLYPSDGLVDGQLARWVEAAKS